MMVELPKGSYVVAFHERTNGRWAHRNGGVAARCLGEQPGGKCCGGGETAIPGTGAELGACRH